MVGFVLVSVVLAACSHTPKPPATAKVTSPTTAAASTAPTTSAPQPKLVYAHRFTPAQQAVAQGYFAAVQAFVAASAQPKLSETLLAATHAGPMLAAARKDISMLVKKDQAVRLPTFSKYLVRIDGVTLGGATATVRLCSVDDGVLYERATGRVVDATVVSRLRRATMRRAGRRWQLVDRDSGAKRRGERACQ